MKKLGCHLQKVLRISKVVEKEKETVNRKIAVAGTGYVGLSLGGAFSATQQGYQRWILSRRK